MREIGSENGSTSENFTCRAVDKRLTFLSQGLVMEDQNKASSGAYDFMQLAQHAFAQARANLERARVLTEMGETYLENARLAEHSALQTLDSPVLGAKPPHARQ